jgi:hypothetical protein
MGNRRTKKRWRVFEIVGLRELKKKVRQIRKRKAGVCRRLKKGGKKE